VGTSASSAIRRAITIDRGPIEAHSHRENARFYPERSTQRIGILRFFAPTVPTIDYGGMVNHLPMTVGRRKAMPASLLRFEFPDKQPVVSLNPPRSIVLVVDDEPSMLVFVPLILDQLGIKSLAAAGGLEAIELIRTHPGEVWLVLQDIDMPGMDGRAAWAALKAEDPGLRCCFMTGGGVPRDLRQLLASGAEFVLLKPFTADALAKVVARPPPT
jgi:CheY-like chemotaxis protein